MKKRFLSLLLCLGLTLGALVMPALGAPAGEDIVILYENDVHCAVEGYSKLSAMKKQLQKTHDHVAVVSSGDYLQGSSLGAVSQGAYIVELINLVGYDALALGNHEFDYKLPRLEELMALMDTQPVCCNFRSVWDDVPYFEPYTLVSYGDVDIAYIGITTPLTVTSSSPAQFKDSSGNYLYTFSPAHLAETVQETVDHARSQGADHVIALSHVGYEGDVTVEDLIEATQGIDVFLDAHSHLVIEEQTLTNRAGQPVLLTSTGTKFRYIGQLTLSQGQWSSHLVDTESYPDTDPEVDACIQRIQEEYAVLGERLVAQSQVELITHDAQGNRLIRNTETNLGNLCADALRAAMGADVGLINGGGIRAPLPMGALTYNDLLNVFPFNNTIVMAQVEGQTLLDMLEMAMMTWPEEGSFPHVSGMTFSVNTAIPSSVVLDEYEEFVEVAGEYRVYDIRILDRQTGKYVPMDPEGTYTLASHNYYLIDHGSGMTMLKNARIVTDDGLLDVEALERYILEDLGGTIGEEYAQVRPCISFTEGRVQSHLWMLFLLPLAILAAAIVCYLLLKNRRKTAA